MFTSRYFRWTIGESERERCAACRYCRSVTTNLIRTSLVCVCVYYSLKKISLKRKTTGGKRKNSFARPILFVNFYRKYLIFFFWFAFVCAPPHENSNFVVKVVWFYNDYIYFFPPVHKFLD